MAGELTAGRCPVGVSLADLNQIYRCELPTGHRGIHVRALPTDRVAVVGGTAVLSWDDASAYPGQCGTVRPHGRPLVCTLQRGHLGHHVAPSSDGHDAWPSSRPAAGDGWRPDGG